MKHVGFGTEGDIRDSRLAVSSARSEELKTKWRAMHCFHPVNVVSQIGGLRGPIHIGVTYTKLALEIILQLISESSGKLAHGNREDVVRANGCLMLTTFLASPSGPFSRLASAILSNLSKVWESFLPMLTSGCIGSAVKSMQYLRTVLDVGKTGLKPNKHDKVSAQDSYLACLDLITSTAEHAAGMYRACMGYRYLVPAHGAIERVDYRTVISILHSSMGYTKARLMDESKAYLGHIKLLRELGAMILFTEVPEILTKALKCLFTILCTEAHDPAVVEITALQGVLMIRLGELVHHQSIEVGTLALSIFLQACCEHRSRQQMSRIKVERLLLARSKFILKGEMVYAMPGLHRNIAFTAALCRQFNWRFYDPQVFHNVLLGVLPFNENASLSATNSKPALYVHSPDSVRQILLLDLLRTMRTSNDLTDEQAEQLSVADWVILVNNEPQCLGLSKAAAVYGAKALVDFIVHPNEVNYYETLPLHESSATCVILEGLSTDNDTAALSYSVGVINFMAKYLYLCKYLFLGKRMLNSQILVLLNGIKSASMALGRYARSCMADVSTMDSYITMVRSSELLATVLFFMNTLSISHPKLEKQTRELQIVVGIGCLDFLNMYAELMIYANGKSKVAALSDLYPPAAAVVHVSSVNVTCHFSIFLIDVMACYNVFDFSSPSWCSI